MISVSNYTRIALLATLLGLSVVVLGAYVRLSHAGLSCPDWPGCYGQALVPEASDAVASANQAFPERPVDIPRAWKEMVHRYLAGILGLLILALTLLAWRRRHRPGQLLAVPFVLLVLVIFQAALGMWTVTLLLKPIVVTAHLLGGITTVALLWWLSLRQGRLFVSTVPPATERVPAGLSMWFGLGIVLLYLQITLGGWTSTNYAALACPDFPTCQTHWVPPLDFKEALQPWHGLGKNYEGGHLDNDARVTIHFLHRIGAIVVSLYFLFLAAKLLRTTARAFVVSGLVLVAVLATQVGLGISNVVLHLPLSVAVAHNGVAALLLLVTLCVYHMARPPRTVAV